MVYLPAGCFPLASVNQANDGLLDLLKTDRSAGRLDLARWAVRRAAHDVIVGDPADEDVLEGAVRSEMALAVKYFASLPIQEPGWHDGSLSPCPLS